MFFPSLHRAFRAIVANGLIVLSGVAFQHTPCHARGIGDLKTNYATALSVQIDPATISDADLLRIRAAGFEFVRFGVRPPRKDVNPGLIDYSTVLYRVRASGLRSIVTLFGGRGVWGAGGGSGIVDGNDARFAAFALDFMKSHANDVAVWEIWNEPDHHTFLDKRLYADFGAAVSALCAGIEAMRPVPPVVVGFGFAKMPLISDDVPAALSELAVSAARRGCLTDLSVHPYRRVPETAIASFQNLREKLAGLKLTIDVAASEWGYATYLPVRGDRDQANLLLREYLVSAAAGIRLLNIYAWRDRGVSVFAKEDNFGIVSFSGQPKEAYSALTKLLALLKNARKVSFTRRSDLSELVFDSGSARIHIVWTQGAKLITPVAVSRFGTCRRTSFTTTSVDETCGTFRDGFISVTASDEPVAYVIEK